MAAGWAINTGADGLILTGQTFEESLRYLSSVRQSTKGRRLVLGGSVDETNVVEALQYADGIVVSSALKRADWQPEDVVRWIPDKVSRFMDAARSAAGTHAKPQEHF